MRILEIIEKEAAGNYKNGAVFGGFAEFLLSWAEKNGAAELARLAGEYAEAPLIERPSLLRKIKAEAELLPPEKEETAERAEASLSERPSLETPIQYLKNVGPKRVALFQHLGVNTIGDLLFYFPRDYRDRRQAQEIGALSVGDAASVRGVVTRVEELRPNPRIHILKACVSDGAGLIPAVWFNQKFLQKQLVKGREMLVCGKVEKKYGQLQLSVQEYEFLDGEGADSPGIVPVYRATESLPQKFLRGSVKTALEKYARFVKEILPEELVRARALPPRAQALRDMHFPASFEAKEAARRRFAYEELLVLQLVICARGQDKPEQGVAHPADPELFERFSRELPYELTGAQKRVINEIFADMEAPAPMARLVQGDVGCGKTAVAAAA
ncbi:MAG: hypothetical protein FWD39_04910, partial [Clostridiales bacterium]|nr:hypothetical protein [Clostridiales bacterium]